MPSSFRDGIHPAEDSEACRAIAALYFNALTSYLQVSAPVEKEPSSAGESVWQESEASVPNSALSSRPASEKTVSKPSVPGEPSSGEQLNRSSKLTEMPSQTAASSPAESSRVLSVVSGCSYENAPGRNFFRGRSRRFVISTGDTAAGTAARAPMAASRCVGRDRFGCDRSVFNRVSAQKSAIMKNRKNAFSQTAISRADHLTRHAPMC